MSRNYLVTIAIFLLASLVTWLIFFPRAGFDSGVPGMPMTQVVVPTLDAAATEGEALFNLNCAKCHGTNAAGDESAGPPLVHAIYKPSHHIDAAFYLATKIGTRAHHWQFGNMPRIPEVTEEEVAQIIGYVRALQRANGIN